MKKSNHYNIPFLKTQVLHIKSGYSVFEPVLLSIAIILLLVLLCSCAATQTGGVLESDKKSITESSEMTGDEIASALADYLKGQELVYTSGVGAWKTAITFGNDLSFTGRYVDYDRGSDGYGNPVVDLYESDFSGSFTDIRKISEFAYVVTLNELTYEKSSGIVWYDEPNGEKTRHTATDAYGLSGCTTLYIYLPGGNTSDVKQEYINCLPLVNGNNVFTGEILPFLGIYCPETNAAFIVEDDYLNWFKDNNY